MTEPEGARKVIADLSHIPRWWRWLFPELNDLQYNAVYAAFEIRRRSTGYTADFLRRLASWLMPILIWVMISLTMHHFFPRGIILESLPVIAALLLYFSLAEKKSPKIPCSYSELLKKADEADSPLAEFLLTAPSPRDILVLAGLEKIADWRFNCAVALILAAGATGALIYWGGIEFHILAWALVPIVCIPVFHLTMLKTSIQRDSKSHCKHVAAVISISKGCRCVTGTESKIGVVEFARKDPTTKMGLLIALLLPIALLIPFSIAYAPNLMRALQQFAASPSGKETPLGQYILLSTIPPLIVTATITSLLILILRKHRKRTAQVLERHAMWLSDVLPLLARVDAGDIVEPWEYKQQVVRRWEHYRRIE
ncbi:hypothetical protein KQI84_08305 [bacterium]|nr:hypothetical protein [bacterium]